MRLAVDTSAYTAFCKNKGMAVAAIQRADQIILPLMVIAELRAGFAMGKRGDKNEQILQRFLNSDRVSIGSPNENTCYIYARLYSYLRRNGTPIPINDLWIASITLQNDAILLTFDQHFHALPQIPKWS